MGSFHVVTPTTWSHMGDIPYLRDISVIIQIMSVLAIKYWLKVSDKNAFQRECET
jgi:hypothetical protein